MAIFRPVITNLGAFTDFFVYCLRRTASQNSRLNLIGLLILICCYFLLPGFLFLPVILIFGMNTAEIDVLLAYSSAVSGLLIVYGYLRATKHETDFIAWNFEKYRIIALVVLISALTLSLRALLNELYNGISLQLLSDITRPSPFVIAGIFTVLLIKPVSQELFFRGILLNHLKISFKPKYAITLASLVYAVYLTLPQSPDNMLHFLSLFTVLFSQGIILGYCYHKTKNLFTLVVAHFTIDIGILLFVI